MLCDRCKQSSDSLTGGYESICPKCEVGQADPLAWMLDHALEQLRARGRGNSVICGTSILNLNAKRQVATDVSKEPCIALGLTLTSHANPNPLYYEIEVLRWTDGGSTALKHMCMQGTVLDAAAMLRQALQSTWDHVLNHLCDCTICERTIQQAEVGGRHMASVYCKSCWPKYQERNSAKCSLCGSPYFACCC